MVIPRDSPKGKPVTNTKGRLVQLLREPVVCSGLHGIQHAEAAEMAARSSIFNRRMVERREAFANIVDTSFDFRRVLLPTSGSKANEFGKQFEVQLLSNSKGSCTKNLKHRRNLRGSSNAPHAHGTGIVIFPVLTPNDSALDAADGTQVAPEATLNFLKEGALVITLSKGEANSIANPVRVTDLGSSPVGPNLSTAVCIEESTKFRVPHIICHEEIVPDLWYNDESSSNRIVHYHDVLVSAATLGSNINSTSGYFPIEGLTEQIIREYDVKTLYDVPMIRHAMMEVDASDDAIGAVFSKEALLFLSTSNMLHSETEHDKNLRAWDMVMTSEYGVGEIEDQWGFKIIADASLPTA